MDEDPFPGYGLRPVLLTDQAELDSYFKSLVHPLSDYTFSQVYTWRNSLRILWKVIDGHLCVFANGGEDLTLLMPPIGDGASDRALDAAWDVMRSYNDEHGVPERSRIEYVSEELLDRFDAGRLNLQPMGTDYVYDVRAMIDLPGGDLASKRQAKNRFLRNYQSRVEPYRPSAHLTACQQLLDEWKQHQDGNSACAGDTNAIKRQKESMACRLALEDAEPLGLRGMVVYVKDVDGIERMRAFTLGEALSAEQSSIVIEKTDLQIKGLAQFIFSEFCRASWAEYPLVNVGDDWGLQTLAWTKLSYRPVKLLQKYTMARVTPQQVVSGFDGGTARVEDVMMQPAHTMPILAAPMVRAARKEDVEAAVLLEQNCFSADSISKRQLQYLQRSQNAVFLVAEEGGRVVGEGIALVRHHKRGLSGRIYSLAVIDEYRGRKIGQRLMQGMIDALWSRGVRRIYLEVDPENRGAIRLYQNLGFWRIGVLPNYYANGQDALHMMCEVPAMPSLFDAQMTAA